jgi:SAM-dependent methyltransferase
MMRDTDRDWEQIAKEQPYWGVLSAEEFRGKDIADANRTRFFQTGEQYVGDLLGFIAKHFKPVQLNRVLDFGCGVGRLTIPFARRAGATVGLDVSQTMLDICRKNAEDVGLQNIVCALSDDELNKAEGEFDFVNSTIVLQHIEPTRGLKILVRLLKKVRKGGAFALQLTYARGRQFLTHEQPKAQYYRRSGNMIFDLLPNDEPPPIGTISMFDYDLNEVIPIIQQYSGSPTLMLPTRDDNHLGVEFIGVRSQ